MRISPGPIETIDHVGRFYEAAQNLATRNCAYKIPQYVQAGDAYLASDEQKIESLVHALDYVRPGWITLEHTSRVVTPETDFGMHGNPYEPAMMTPDYLHYHRTIQGSVVITFASALPRYLDERNEASACLTDALRRGMTDTRYADPATFQQVQVNAGEAIVFRLSEASGMPFLHDFCTVGASRVAEITALMRMD